MPLTELNIAGFKSFAEPTTIHFSRGITGIVGPNGSGKSNITEAIRWVMGESSAKSLRGTNMKDVIFAGSESREPLNHASVTMIFDNQARSLKMDADRLAITRRILRSGESEYLINNRQVRQKDVRALFLDSGMSQNSLAIISQGRVDQILNSRPEDRRLIFEEAAGVSHFKQQKEAAEGELAQTNTNLIRINDLVKELAGRIEPLHEQSSLAKEYQFQKAGLDGKLKTLLAFEISDFAQQRDELKQAASKNQVILDRLDREVKESQAEVNAKKAQSNKLSQQREALQAQLLTLTQQLSTITASLQVSQQSSQFDAATKTEYEKQVAGATTDLTTTNQALDQLAQQLTALTEQTKAMQEKRQQLANQAANNPAQLTAQLNAKRNDYIQSLQTQTSVNNDLGHLQDSLKRLTADQALDTDRLAPELASAQATLTQLQKTGEQLKQQRQTLQTQLTDQTTQLTTLQTVAQAGAQRQAKLQRQVEQLTARREALSQIQKRHEGYYYGVRNVLNHLTQFPGVIGAVGELLSFPAELEIAITTALGGGVQNLITDTRLSARNAINRLKASHAGRATFLPLDGLHSYEIPADIRHQLSRNAGFKGIASELVSYTGEADISVAIHYLLGNVIVVDRIETAMQIQRQVRRYRLITLDGDVVSPGGSMTGGERNQRNNSPLQTTTEIAKLAKQLSQMQASLQAAQEVVKTKGQAVTTLKAAQVATQLQLQTLTQKLGEAAVNFQSQDREVKRLRDAHTQYNEQLTNKKTQLVEVKAAIAAKTDEQAAMTKQLATEKQEVAALETRLAHFSTANQQSQTELAALDAKLAVHDNERLNLRSKQREQRQQAQRLEQTLTQLKQKLGGLTSNGQLSTQKQQELTAKAKTLGQKKADLSAKLATLSGQLGQFEAKIDQLDQVAGRNYDLRKDAVLEQERYSIAITKLTGQVEQRLDQLSHDYHLTYEAALAQASSENTPEARSQLQKAVKLHRMSLADIGHVNLDAITEYDEVKQRYDFLDQQQTDLITARKDLEASMAELDETVKQRFNKTFKQIAASFEQIFPVVFGGGSAKLILTDPTDLLTTGVEIIASPPGKRLRRLSLLSGGERALTAITLLFAMLQVNTVPFCILDEVEAALDETNVTRFAQFMQKYDMHTQFIVITHRRGMMQQADQLFGVVMQESGVSRVLSVSLTEWQEDKK